MMRISLVCLAGFLSIIVPLSRGGAQEKREDLTRGQLLTEQVKQEVARCEAILTRAGRATDNTSLLQFFRNRTLSATEQARLMTAIRELGASSFRVREKASADLRSLGKHALPLLQKALNSSDLEVRRRAKLCLERIDGTPDNEQLLAAAYLLRIRKPTGTVPVLLAYLTHSEPLVQEQLLATLQAIGIRGQTIHPDLVNAAHDPNPTRRLAAARVLPLVTAYHAKARALLNDPSAQVRWLAAKGLVASGDRAAVSAIIALLKVAPAEVAWQAEILLRSLAGSTSPSVFLGNAEETDRQKCQLAWTQWWQANQARVDLKKLANQPRKLGFRLVIAVNGYGKQGRIWELGPDRKVRWELREVGGPFDALVLPGERILIAEYEKRKISERDRKGKVLWEHRLSSGPLCVQRLANGNTFVATNYQLVELSPTRQRLFSHRDRKGNIFWGRRMRDGSILYGTYDGWLVRLDRKGKESKRVAIPRPDQGLVNVVVLPDGRLLLPRTKQNKVVELDPQTGKVLWQINVPQPTCVALLPGGNLFVGSHTNNEIMEVTRKGKILWREQTKGQVFGVRCR